MPVLDSYSVRKRAWQHGYKEVPSSSLNILSFEHHCKLGCGGWRNKERSGEESMLFLSCFLLPAEWESHSRCELRCRQGVHTNTGHHVGHHQWQDDEDLGYRSGYFSGDYYSPRNDYYSDDTIVNVNYYSDNDFGYSPRNKYYSDDAYSSRASQS